MKKIILSLGIFILAFATNAAAYSDLIGYNPLESSGPTSSAVFVDVIGNTSLGSYDATYFGYLGGNVAGDWSGYYLGTIDGNDNANLSDAIREYIGTAPTTINKVDALGTSSGSLNVTYDTGNTSGTWTSTAPLPNNAIQFYTVKGGPQYALYFLDPTQTTGFWNTDHVFTSSGNNPEVSHISATFAPGGTGGGPGAVPEPATMLLFGIGLAGLAGLRMRKKNK